MFDCVLPTRNARHGMLYTANGVINIKNAKWKNDFSPIDESIPSPTSREYSKAYLRHLIHNQEILGAQIASLHNLGFFLWLVKEARKHILAGDFASWKAGMVNEMQKRI
jgi:queuine tRNA-ribosyltransferase